MDLRPIAISLRICRGGGADVQMVAYGVSAAIVLGGGLTLTIVVTLSIELGLRVV
jgi:hypothetical protein